MVQMEEEDSAVDWAEKDDTERCSAGSVSQSVVVVGALPPHELLPSDVAGQAQRHPSVSVSYYDNHSNTFHGAAKSVDTAADVPVQFDYSS